MLLRPKEPERLSQLVLECVKKGQRCTQIVIARDNRRMVLELLDSANDLSQSEALQSLISDYGADKDRYTDPATVATPPKVEDDLFARIRSMCTLLQMR